MSLPGEFSCGEAQLQSLAKKKNTLFILKPNIYLEVLVKFILSDIDVEAESELLILHVIGRLHRGFAASTVWFGGQLVVMVQKLLKWLSISCFSKYF